MNANSNCILISLVLCIALTCSVSAMDAYPRTITDSAGRTVTIQMPIERIIVQSGYAAQAVTILGDGDKIIGVIDTIHKRNELYPNLKDTQVVGTWNTFDYELIGQMVSENDTIVPNVLVICYSYGTSGGKSYAVDLHEKGFAPLKNITVVGLDFSNSENVTDSMTKLGTILGKEAEAQNYVNWYEKRKLDAVNAVKGRSLPKVYIESSSAGGLGALTLYGTASGFGELVRLAGGFNVAKDLKDRFPKVTWEWVLTQNPDVMIRYQSADTFGWQAEPSSDTVALEKTRNEMMSRPGGDGVSAIKSNRVYLCYSEMLYGPGSVVGLTYLAKMLHPEADLDPLGVYREYTDLLGIEFPEKRTFVYPEILASK
ncbi:MAG: ABC transporter substrate-binding protein [Methanothrix sp.]|nr:ABC transporter substrate-binding protein [Methanothrix sp.]